MPNALPRIRTAAFTLFEVAISLALVAFAVAVIVPAFPTGLKAQQYARFRLLALAKAEEMVESFNTSHSANPGTDTESPNAWDVPVSHRSQAWDLEQRLNSHRFGIFPVPIEIVRRLDSDNDVIQRLSADGARLYYSQPAATTNVEESSQFSSFDPANPGSYVPPPLANEAQKLVFAVVGFAQNNAIHILPQKNWPYYNPYPSPPYHGIHYFEYLPTGMTTFVWGPWYGDPGNYPPNWKYGSACTEEASDPDIKKVFFWTQEGKNYGFLPYGYGNRVSDPAKCNMVAGTGGGEFNGLGIPSADAAKAYVQSALWYAQKKGAAATSVGAGVWQDFILPPVIPTGAAIGDFPAGMSDDQKWMAVQTMRFLAHSTACLTGAWYAYNMNAPIDYHGHWPYDTEDLGTTGVKIAHVQLDGFDGPSGDQTITDALIRYYHDKCMNCAMKYSASFPYDWAAPRPAQRSIMMDFPLLEYDMFSPPLSGPMQGTAGVTGSQWKPIPASPIANFGGSYQYPGANPDISGNVVSYPPTDPLWGNTDHFTLCAPFDPAERCRQIVFWTVDWMQYEDAELLPSAPVDASKYAFAGARGTAGGKFPGGFTLANRMGDGSWGGIKWWDQLLFAYRNPEKSLVFMQDVSSLATGSDVSGVMLLNRSANNGGAFFTQDQGPSNAAKMIFSGMYGADRNFNMRLDRGPVPKSARLRAIEVARFNYYDPRIPNMMH